jgi:hypothetical protein
MHVTYQLTLDDFYQGMLAWRNRRRWQQWVRWASYFLVAGGSLTSLLILLLDRRAETTTTAVFTVIFGILWFAYMLLAPRLSARRQFGNNPLAQSPITLDVSEQGLEFHNPHAESKVAWSAYVAWGEAKSVFVIMPQPRAYVAIPKRAFSEGQVSEFRDRLRRNIVTK